MERRHREMQKIIHDTALATTGLAISGDDAAGAGEAGVDGDNTKARVVLDFYKEASSAISLGWALEGFGSDAVTGDACQLATFTAFWLGLYIDRGGDGGVSNDGSLSQPSSPAASSKIIPPLIETMCGSWVRAASFGRPDQFLSRSSAEDAAMFCGQLMERVSPLLPPSRRFCLASANNCVQTHLSCIPEYGLVRLLFCFRVLRFSRYGACEWSVVRLT